MRRLSLPGVMRVLFGAVILSTGVIYLVAVSGQGGLFSFNGLGRALDSMGDSLLHGSTSVDPGAIMQEGFLVAPGRTEMYYGPFPALLRIPLNFIFPPMWGAWSRLLTALSALLAVLAAFQILFEATFPARGFSELAPREQLLALVLFLGIAWGSPITFLPCSGDIYHEVLSWALAATLGLTLLVLRAARKKDPIRPSSVAVAGMLAGVALSSKVTLGVVACSLFVIYYASFLLRRRRSAASAFSRPFRWQTAVMPLVPWIVCLAFQGWVNHSRWGNVFQFADMTKFVFMKDYYNNSYNTNLTATLRWERVPETISMYFGADWNQWLGVVRDPYPLFEDYSPDRRIIFERIEPALPMLYSCPWILLLSLLGIGYINLRDFATLGVVLVGFAEGAAILSMRVVSNRYSCEFLVLFLSLSSLSLPALFQPGRGGRRSGAVLALLTLLVVYSAWISLRSTFRWVDVIGT